MLLTLIREETTLTDFCKSQIYSVDFTPLSFRVTDSTEHMGHLTFYCSTSSNSSIEKIIIRVGPSSFLSKWANLPDSIKLLLMSKIPRSFDVDPTESVRAEIYIFRSSIGSTFLPIESRSSYLDVDAESMIFLNHYLIRVVEGDLISFYIDMFEKWNSKG